MSLENFGVDIKPKENTDPHLDINLSQIQQDHKGEELERYLPWFLKYQVKELDDLTKTEEVEAIISYVENFKKGVKSLLLVGAPGSGKTTTVTLIAKQYDLELFELNASDTRNKKAITESVGDVIKQQSLFGKQKLILVDEADGVSGNNDRGGVAELSKIVKESPYPILFTANDPDSDKIKNLKKVAKFINFENHSKKVLFNLASTIFKKEKIKYDEKKLEAFVDERNTADIRGFINDLQSCVIAGEFITEDELEIRDYKKKIEQLLDHIYFSYPEETLKEAFNTDINLDDLMLYVEENTPSILEQKNVIQAFQEISKADIFKGRIMKWQYWRYLVYINFYLTYAISTHKGKAPKKVTYKKNSRILKKWIYGNKMNVVRPRTKIEKKKDVDPTFLERLAKLYGRSANRTRKEDLFFFLMSYRNDEEFRIEMNTKLDIDKTLEVSLLTLEV